jgi:uncharacterized delta-60 repeat protein
VDSGDADSADRSVATCTSGALDQTFGAGGTVLTPALAPGYTAILYLFVQPDGRILAVGTSGDTVVIRYLEDGTLDPSFGQGGIAVPNPDIGANGAALQADGKIVIGGTLSVSSDAGAISRGAIQRLNADGTIDKSFGDQGLALTDMPFDGAGPVEIDRSGRILAGASGGPPSFRMLRFTADGHKDTSFGDAGAVITQLQSDDWIEDIVVQPDDKILAAGAATPGTEPYSFALARYHPSGELDTAFGAAGKDIAKFTGYDFAKAAAVQKDGKILEVGVGLAAPGSQVNVFGVAQFDATGLIDSTFGGGSGRATYEFPKANYMNTACLGLQSDGKIVVSGAVPIPESGTCCAFGVMRFNVDGTIDDSFGHEGLALAQLSTFDKPFALAIQRDDKILVGGDSASYKSVLAPFALTRFCP